MKITHFMTIDVGTGPVTLVEILTSESLDMLRIVHRAAFNAVGVVDPVSTKDYVAGIRGARLMSATVLEQHEDRIGDEIACWCEARGVKVHKVRWRDGRDGKILENREDLEQYDAANVGFVSPKAAPRSTRMML